MATDSQKRYRDESDSEEGVYVHDNAFDALKQRPRTSTTTYYKIALGFCAFIIFALLYLVARPQYAATSDTGSVHNVPSLSTGSHIDSGEPAPNKALVLASFQKQDVNWLKDVPKDWKIYRYMLDDNDPFAPLGVPRNKGREGMAYLTFIIQHYHALPNYTIFIHGHERSWHSPEPTSWKVRALNLTALDEEGYINLRCSHDPGCTEDTMVGAKYMSPVITPVDGVNMPNFWDGLFPKGSEWGEEFGEYPDALAQPCCAQFAVTKKAVLNRPYEFWRGFRRPMERDTKENRKIFNNPFLTDHRMGTYYEKVWHVAFGKPAYNCPKADHCRKNFFSDQIRCEKYTERYLRDKGWQQIKCNNTWPDMKNLNGGKWR